MARIGIFSGAFDPVHDGHIGFCLEALKSGLDRVILLPERNPRGKQNVTDFAHRVAMLKLAAAEHPGLEVAELPDERFTVAETLPELKERYGNDLVLLVGSDVAKNILNWADVQVLANEVDLLIALRADDTQQAIADILGSTLRFNCFKSTHTSLASTNVRQGGAGHHSEVRDYIARNQLYKQ